MSKLTDRIEELEKRVRELEARPTYHPPVYVPYPVYPAPVLPVVPYPWHPVPYWPQPTWVGGGVGFGIAAGIGDGFVLSNSHGQLTYGPDH